MIIHDYVPDTVFIYLCSVFVVCFYICKASSNISFYNILCFAIQNSHSRIYVEVTSIVLWPDCGVLQDPMVQLIFVDFHGFLGLPPDLLETPVSLPKNAPDSTLNFNFGQGEFRHEKRRKYDYIVYNGKESLTQFFPYSIQSFPYSNQKKNRFPLIIYLLQVINFLP